MPGENAKYSHNEGIDWRLTPETPVKVEGTIRRAKGPKFFPSAFSLGLRALAQVSTLLLKACHKKTRNSGGRFYEIRLVVDGFNIRGS
jgi:hypothetical protein